MLRGLRGTMGSKDINKTFLPATVSELVSEWHSVEARIFFGFELLAAGPPDLGIPGPDFCRFEDGCVGRS